AVGRPLLRRPAWRAPRGGGEFAARRRAALVAGGAAALVPAVRQLCALAHGHVWLLPRARRAAGGVLPRARERLSRDRRRARRGGGDGPPGRVAGHALRDRSHRRAAAAD